ncbi:MAG TPA: prolyl oligopeptidase family serine peptidase [Sedimentisphaerales bacterium]|jgi:prolyl oligopeptidase|nr:prolyl oligopeptidase family serine peptidase [Sedimentisphaerales bacterium]HNU30782.1 prolyl oligopeptidase family serine peptidase [Sedimentisphaerales bacterium]
MNHCTVGLFSATLLVACSQAVVAAQQDDPYLWLEEVRGEKALEWVKARNGATLAVLQAQPGFQETYDKALEILNSNVRISYPQILGKYLYNFWQDEKNERGLWRRTTLEQYCTASSQWEVLLDIDRLCREEGEQWVFKGADGLYPDYDRFLVRLSKGGGDAVVVREFDAAAKRFVADGFVLPEAKSDVCWRDRDSLYVGTDFGPGSLTDSGYPRIARLWKRGTPLSSAETVFEGEGKDVEVGFATINTPERRYDVVHRGITFYTAHTYVIEDGRPLKLDIPDDADFGGFFKNQLLVKLKSDWKLGANTYRQGALIAIDYDKYLKGNRAFHVIVEPNERSNVVSFADTRNMLLVHLLDNVRSELYAFRLEGGRWSKQRIDAPALGTLGVVSTDDRSDQYFFTYQGFLKPTSLYYVPDGGPMREVKSLPHFFDANGLTTEQCQATSRDGTQIPYFVVRPRDVKADGANPTLLYGYGGFEIEMLPGYSATTGACWLAQGGVYVLANIRGGGEFGPAWHQAALKANRQRAFDDFAAVAEDLIRRKITSPAHLGIMGGSNGGLLMGVELTQRPDLYNAVVCMVPLLDMRRYNKLLAGASWMAEYGDPDVPEEWAYISKYSPYHNLRVDGKYPHVFFYTSTADDRVHPGHARKMAAKMEGMGQKVYYYENLEGGHAGAAINKHLALRTALTYSYLWMQLK